MKSEIESIIRGNLRPDKGDTRTEDYYEPEIRSIKSGTEQFTPHYQIVFAKPTFSAKVQYYKSLIDNIINTKLNDEFSSLKDADTDRIAFHRKEMQELIDKVLLEINTLIRQNNYSLTEIMATQIDYSFDLQHKECTYIYHYMILSLIRCYMEFQYHFNAQIEDIKKRDAEYFFVRVLKISMPENVGIREIEQVDAVQKSIKVAEQSPTYFKYKYLTRKAENIKMMFDELKATKRITDDSSLTEFKHLFNGIKVEQPIQWISTKSDLSYLFKQIKKYLEIPHNCHYWEIVNAAFVDKKGMEFGVASLRDSKIPKTTEAQIAAIAQLLE